MDRDTLLELYDRLAPALLALAERITGARDRAEEILEHVFRDAWRSGAHGALAAGPLFLDTRRRALAARVLAPPAPPGWPLPDAPRGATSPARERARGLVGSLPLRERWVLELAYFEGLSLQDVAGRTHRELDEVRLEVRAALGKLAAAARDGGGR